MGTLGGDGKLTFGDGGKLTLGDDGISAAGAQRVLGNDLLEESVDCNLLIKNYDHWCKAAAVSFLSLKRDDAEGDRKTSVRFVAAK